MTRRALAFAAALTFSAGVAHAGGSGVGIPETGGQGAGASSADARGLSANPAAAVGAGRTELFADGGFLVLDVHYERAPYRDPTDPANDRTFDASDSLNMALVPYLAVRSDAPLHSATSGKVGTGLSISVPFGRNVHFAPSHPGRYHVVTADFNTVYVAPALAIRPVPSLRFGIGPVIGVTTLRLRQRVDLAPTLQELAPGDPPVPPESGLLEGEVLVRHAQGTSFGVTAGALIDLGPQATIGLGFTSQQQVDVKGRSRVTPSRDLTLYTKGDFTLTQNLPPIVNLGGRYRLASPWEFSGELQWTGWSVNRYYHLQIEDSEIASSSGDMQDLMDFLAAQGFDLNEGQIVENIFDKDQYIARGHRDSVSVIFGAEHGRGTRLKKRVELGYETAAVPDDHANVGNVDFDTIVVGAGLTWRPGDSDRFELGGGWTQFVLLPRTIRDSKFTTHGVPHEYAFPSGNGKYSAILSRIALNAAWRF